MLIDHFKLSWAMKRLKNQFALVANISIFQYSLSQISVYFEFSELIWRSGKTDSCTERS